MYCCLSTTKECEALYGLLPDSVYGELLRGIAVLESDGEGFSLVADSKEDLELARKVFDDRVHYCEWATKISRSDYCSALYLLTNESSVMLYIPISLANDDILENLED